MNVHQIYAQKQKEYEDYRVEARVYEQKLQDATTRVEAAIDALRNSIDSITYADIRASYTELLGYLDANKENLASKDIAANVVSKLDNIKYTLEARIMEALR